MGTLSTHAANSPLSLVEMASAIASMVAAAPAVKVAPVANTAQARNMMTWNPIGNTMYETFSFLPPLTDAEIARQVDYIISNGWTPCLEVSPAETSACDDVFDSRYWSLWKLPMFGCTNAQDVLREIMAAKRAFPDCYVRVCAFDADEQVQTASFLVQRISMSLPIEKRSVA